MTKKEKEEKPNPLLEIKWEECDNVVKRALEFQRRSKPTFDTYVSLQGKLEKAYDRVFNIDKIDMDDSKLNPNIFFSALGRTVVEIFKKSIVMPMPEVNATSRISPKDRSENALELSSIAQSLMTWATRESFMESIFNRAKEFWIAFGDVFLSFFVRKGRKRNMIGLQMTRGKNLILDPDGKLLDAGNPAEDSQASYKRYVLTKEQMMSMFGKDIVKYVTAGNHFKTITTEKGNTPGATYYEMTEGMNKAEEEEVTLLGGNAFPVYRFAEDDSFKKKVTAAQKKELGEGKIIEHGDKYRYYDSLGNPYINDTQLHCFFDDKNPTNFGMMQKMYSSQYAEELIENGRIDGFRRGNENMTYATGVRPSSFRAAQQEYLAKKKHSLFETMILPPSLAGQNPKVEVLEYPSVDALTAKQTSEEIMRLARNIAGVDPNRLEIQKNEGLGLREQLQEEKTESIQEVIDDNLLAFTKLFEKLLNFIIVHKGLGLNDVFIDFVKYSKSPVEGVTFENKKARISITDAAKRLGEENWDLHVSINKDSLIKKSNAILLERILSFMERVDPNAFPDLYKKLILTLNDLLPTEIVAEDIIQKAPAEALGGSSQFKSGGVAPGQPAQAPNQAPQFPGGPAAPGVA